MASFAQLLDSVPEAEPGELPGTYRVQRLPGTSMHYIGRNGQGHPSLLLGSPAGRLHAPVKLALIEAIFGTNCSIRSGGSKIREENLTVVTCTAPDTKLQDYFVHVSETIVRIVGPEPTQVEVIEAVSRLIDLFQRLVRPPSRSTIGLIGELILIAYSQDPHALARAWRSGLDDRFDFSVEELRLEVKANASRVRSHYFSFEQCHPPPGTIGVLASIFVELIGGGTSIEELVLRIGEKLADDALFLTVQGKIAETLGSALAEGLAARFDEQLSASSLTFFELNNIPAVRGGLPPELSEIRFRSDLSRHPSVAPSELTRLSKLAGRILPRL